MELVICEPVREGAEKDVQALSPKVEARVVEEAAVMDCPVIVKMSNGRPTPVSCPDPDTRCGVCRVGRIHRGGRKFYEEQE